MSELKAFDIVVAEEGYCEGIVKYRRTVYDKSEVDKVIAEKDAEIAELKEQVQKERSAKVDYKISANDLSDGLKEAYGELWHH